MKKFVALCICAFTLLACESDEPQKVAEKAAPEQTKAQQAAAQPQNDAASAMTDAQVFAYILGSVYGLPSYMNTPQRVGAMVELDAMIQGIVDNERALKDSTWKLQLSEEERKDINEHYEKVAAERRAAGDKAPEIALAGPITGQKVVLADTASMIVKYSYTQGVTIDILFDGMRKIFGEDFETRFFIQGVRESIYGMMDSSFKKAFTDERLNAVNTKYKTRMEKIREEQRRR
jgi:hypothetical protein